MTNTLNSGEWLRPGERLTSENGYHVLVMQEDGNLVLYSTGGPVWASQTPDNIVLGVWLQDDGNFVIYTTDERPIFATGTVGRGKSRLVLRNDGNLAIYDANMNVTWSSNTATDTLYSGQWLRPGERLTSRNGYHTLVMHENGNLVLHSVFGQVWESSTIGHTVLGVTIQDDGNLVIYSSDERPIWATGTEGKGKSRLVMQDNRNAVIYDANNQQTKALSTDTDLSLWDKIVIESKEPLMTNANVDPKLSSITASIICSVPGPSVWVCVGAAVVIVVFLKYKKQWGLDSVRFVSGTISESAKDVGNTVTNALEDTSKLLNDVFGGIF